MIYIIDLSILANQKGIKYNLIIGIIDYFIKKILYKLFKFILITTGLIKIIINITI